MIKKAQLLYAGMLCIVMQSFALPFNLQNLFSPTCASIVSVPSGSTPSFSFHGSSDSSNDRLKKMLGLGLGGLFIGRFVWNEVHLRKANKELHEANQKTQEVEANLNQAKVGIQEGILALEGLKGKHDKLNQKHKLALCEVAQLEKKEKELLRENQGLRKTAQTLQKDQQQLRDRIHEAEDKIKERDTGLNLGRHYAASLIEENARLFEERQEEHLRASKAVCMQGKYKRDLEKIQERSREEVEAARQRILRAEIAQREAQTNADKAEQKNYDLGEELTRLRQEYETLLRGVPLIKDVSNAGLLNRMGIGSGKSAVALYQSPHHKGVVGVPRVLPSCSESPRLTTGHLVHMPTEYDVQAGLNRQRAAYEQLSRYNKIL